MLSRHGAAKSAKRSRRGVAWDKAAPAAENAKRLTAYRVPVTRRPRRPKLAAGIAAAAGQGVAIRGIEVVQAIQSLDDSVRLIAGKATVVRVYVDPTSFANTTLLTGELLWRRGAAGGHYLPAMNRVRIMPSGNLDVHGQRIDIEQSLNFRLPDEAIQAGTIEIRLNRLLVPGGADLQLAASPPRAVTFRSAPSLRVRAVGLRYRSNGNPSATVAPSALHFAYLRSYLTRAYPVAAVEWSQIVIDADALNPPFDSGTSDLANAQLAALRAREISDGMDPRTHYYGLVDNENGADGSFMRGSAMYNQLTAVFGMIASGPCGVPNGWTGDTDASFADWYGAHELGHTFQRRHPGFPIGVQPRDPLETMFPYPDGLISTQGNRFVGFDIGDPALALPMSALAGDGHHDVMTYADRQWLSAYTYEAIHARLLDEDAQLAPPTS